MTRASLVLLVIATELAEMAKNSLPALRKKEIVHSEWFKNASLYRETELKGQKFIAKFDFQRRKSCRFLLRED